MSRCSDYSDTWADATEVAYSCMKKLSRRELARAELVDLVWWWTDVALRAFSEHVTVANAADPRAWAMRGEVG